MKVKAHKKGFYGNKIREPGDEFVLVPYKKKDGKEVGVEQQFAAAWMKKVDAKAAPAAKPEKKEE